MGPLHSNKLLHILDDCLKRDGLIFSLIVVVEVEIIYTSNKTIVFRSNPGCTQSEQNVMDKKQATCCGKKKKEQALRDKIQAIILSLVSIH